MEDIDPKVSSLLKTSVEISCLRAWFGEFLDAALGLFDTPRDLVKAFTVGIESIGIPRHVGGTIVGSILSKACCSKM